MWSQVLDEGAMAEAEAKLRKLATAQCGQCVATDMITDMVAAGTEDAAGKGKGRGASSLLHLRHRLRAFVCRRGEDIVGVTCFFLWVATGTVVAIHLMDPPDAPAICILRPAFKTTWSLFIMCWMSVIYHGPGRLPPEESLEEGSMLGNVLSPELSAALNVGRLCKSKPFNAEHTYCQGSRRWKHPLVHFCKKCQSCSIWMDHHCKLSAQCVGFRNLRCFLVWLVHATALYWCLIFLTVHRLYINGWPQDYYCLLWLPWFFYLLMTARQIGGHLLNIVLQAAGGWHGRVIRRKFMQLEADGKGIHRTLGMLVEGMPREHPQIEEVRVAMNCLAEALGGLRSGVKLPMEQGEMIWGPFLGRGITPMVIIMGSPVSWRWLLPFVPGGSGDPLSPDSYSERGCRLWTELEVAMQRAVTLHEQVMQSQKEQEQRWQAMLSKAARSTP